MLRDVRFWRTATIISMAHIAFIVALVRWNVEAQRPNLQTVVWMSGGFAEATSTQTDSALEKVPPPEPLRSKQDSKPEKLPTTTPSNLQLPAVTPSPALSETPVSKPSVSPQPSPRITPKAIPKPAPKKSTAATTTPKSASTKKKTSADEREKKTEDREGPTKIAPPKANVGSSDKSDSTASSGAASHSEFSWYGKMLHDRFYSEWIQPKTSTPIGAKISALVRIRIEKDGRISNFTIVKPSGNVVVDESIATVGKRVTQVDPLPLGLGSGNYYEVNINFELNAEQ